MKGLILKDFYNLKTIARSYLLILVVFAVTILPSSGPGVYLPMVSVYCSMMTISSFSFDEHCSWDRFALVMPVSRRQVVLAKFAVMVLVALAGVAASVVTALLGVVVMKMDGMEDLLVMAPVSLSLGMVLMGTMLPLIIEFGSERGRLLLLVAMLVPGAMVGAVWFLDVVLDVTISENMVLGLLWASPLAAGAWDYLMYRAACRIYESKEF